MANMLLAKSQPQPYQRSAKPSDHLHALLLRSFYITRLSCFEHAIDAIVCATADPALGLRTSHMKYVVLFPLCHLMIMLQASFPWFPMCRH